jgi:hypothetical protein
MPAGAQGRRDAFRVVRGSSPGTRRGEAPAPCRAGKHELEAAACVRPAGCHRAYGLPIDRRSDQRSFVDRARRGNGVGASKRRAGRRQHDVQPRAAEVPEVESLRQLPAAIADGDTQADGLGADGVVEGGVGAGRGARCGEAPAVAVLRLGADDRTGHRAPARVSHAAEEAVAVENDLGGRSAVGEARAAAHDHRAVPLRFEAQLADAVGDRDRPLRLRDGLTLA